MKRIITGGTGLIGQALVNRWYEEYELIVVGRDRQRIERLFGDKVHALTWDAWQANPEASLEDLECVINLAGANVGERYWTQERKQEILTSRVTATNICAEILSKAQAPAPRLLNASAIGIYGTQTNRATMPDAFTENSEIPAAGDDFLAQVGQAWEAALAPALAAGVPVTTMRFGVVLARDGGALPQMAKPFYFGLGGPIAGGEQVISWISLEDLCRAIDFILLQPELEGVLNLVAPQAVKQKQLAQALGRALHRPSFLPTPGFILKLSLGEMSQLVLEGNHVKPERLEALGFTYTHPDIDSALQALY